MINAPNTGPLAVRAQVLTLHDLGPLEHPEWFRAGFAAWYRLFIPVLAKRVRRILTPTLYMKEKIIKRFDLDEGRVVVTGAGVDRKTFHPGAGLPAGTYDLPKSYVLFVGSIEPRKNLAGLVRAWESLKDEAGETQLVIAGETGPAFRGAALQQPAARVRFLGRVPEAHLPGLYAGAALFALPSLEEGFGLGVLEAMACGTPVLTSDGGALPEVVGDAGLIFSLSEPAALAAALQGCLCDAGLRHRLRERGLRRAEQNSWRTAAEKVWRALQDAG